MRHRCAPLVIGLLIGTVSTSAAGQNENAKVMLHRALTDKAPCTSMNIRRPCDELVVSGDLYPSIHFVYLLVTDGDAAAGINQVHCGTSYDNTPMQGVDVFSWSLCATSESPVAGVNGAWPSSMSGNTLTWDSCQTFEPGGAGTGVVAHFGYFYVGAYGPGDLAMVTHPVDGLVTVRSCAGEFDTVEGGGIVRTPSHLGSMRFSAGGAESGYNPCGLNTPVEGTTWGRIKSLMISSGNG